MIDACNCSICLTESAYTLSIPRFSFSVFASAVYISCSSAADVRPPSCACSFLSFSRYFGADENIFIVGRAFLIVMISTPVKGFNLLRSFSIWSSFYLRKSALRISPTFKFVFFPVTKLGIFFMITSSSAVIHFVSAKV